MIANITFVGAYGSITTTLHPELLHASMKDDEHECLAKCDCCLGSCDCEDKIVEAAAELLESYHGVKVFEQGFAQDILVEINDGMAV